MNTATAQKPFNELTKDEVEELAKECVQGSRSEEEVRERLTNAGFDGHSAIICSHSSSLHFSPEVMVFGPNHEVIRC